MDRLTVLKYAMNEACRLSDKASARCERNPENKMFKRASKEADEHLREILSLIDDEYAHKMIPVKVEGLGEMVVDMNVLKFLLDALDFINAEAEYNTHADLDEEDCERFEKMYKNGEKMWMALYAPYLKYHVGGGK